MTNKTLRHTLISLLLLPTAAITAGAQEQDVIFEAGSPISLDAYGLSFIPTDDMQQVESTHSKNHIEFISYDASGVLTDIDIEIIDRFSYGSGNIANVILNTFQDGGIDLQEVKCNEIDNGKIRGAYMLATLPSGREVITIAVMHIDTADAFIIMIYGRPGDTARSVKILESFNLDPPADKILR